MNIREAVTGFPAVAELEGLEDAWRWSPAPGIDFAGTLSADGNRLIQTSSRDSYEQDLAVAILRFAQEREEEIFARNPNLGSVAGFTAPNGAPFDAVAGVAPAVHRFYAVELPELTPLVRVVFPAYVCEFSGGETLAESITRYQMLQAVRWKRGPVPFLKMRFANTRTLGRSTNEGRGLAEPVILERELSQMADAPGSFVEFENRHGQVWRVEWHGTWYIAEWDTQDGAPWETTLDALLAFASARLNE
ncbi:hypothetical protein RM844_05925 [Streptomyces sp. DSM 44915]|uniref:Uncharacterized protein n=1 Tax=Streptomyces chisholmiae TaxID=3075540 RepID=A0ABU2JLG1_9ACTN|nr:hypothetical protein [Streptomyces sp. DSM 44915]MDT0265826.1 hypothetical protein [Streptomyces sp. DSM 44915]